MLPLSKLVQPRERAGVLLLLEHTRETEFKYPLGINTTVIEVIGHSVFLPRTPCQLNDFSSDFWYSPHQMVLDQATEPSIALCSRPEPEAKVKLDKALCQY